jgi:hypothetical protein
MCPNVCGRPEFPRLIHTVSDLRTRGLPDGVVSSQRGAPIGLSARQRYLLKVATTECTPLDMPYPIMYTGRTS